MPNLTAARVEQTDRGNVVVGWVYPENPPLESSTESLAVIQPKLYRFERLPAPLHAPREQPISAVAGRPHHV